MTRLEETATKAAEGHGRESAAPADASCRCAPAGPHTEAAAGSVRRKVYDLIRLARPRDWIKNVFVILPVPFCIKGGATAPGGSFLWGLAGLCLISSAIYTLNDVLDADADRLHPRKRRRPIAAGAVTRGEATVLIAARLAEASSRLVQRRGGRRVAFVRVCRC